MVPETDKLISVDLDRAKFEACYRSILDERRIGESDSFKPRSVKPCA